MSFIPEKCKVFSFLVSKFFVLVLGDLNLKSVCFDSFSDCARVGLHRSCGHGAFSIKDNATVGVGCFEDCLS